MPNIIDQTKVSEFSKMPFASDEYMDMRGVVDFGNLAQFAPYESGYCFLSVISAPYCMSSSIRNAVKVDTTAKDASELTQKLQNRADYHGALQDAFVKVLEQEFKGLDGIDDITSETMEISDNISTMSLISKTVQNSNSQITMRFTEKTGSLITKYISTYLRCIKDTKTQAKTYGGIITAQNVYEIDPGPRLEVFNLLYIVTDSTCLRVEKAFLILNAQPTTASYSDLFTGEKGNIESKEVTVTFNAFVIDGNVADKIALCYMRQMVNTSSTIKHGKININSWNYNWSYAGNDGGIKKINDINFCITDKKLIDNSHIDVNTSKTETKTIEYKIFNNIKIDDIIKNKNNNEGYKTKTLSVKGTKGSSSDKVNFNN